MVKGEVKRFFKCHFRRIHCVRLLLCANFMERQISEADNVMLAASFSEDEVRDAIWDCDSSKAPRPDGFNF